MINHEKFLYTDLELAEALAVSRSYIRELVARGELPRVQLPETRPQARKRGRPARLLRIHRRDVEALIKRGMLPPRPPKDKG